MNYYFYILLLLTWFADVELLSQSQRFVVEVAPFSSRISDEFSPVLYKDGIVFCSNQRDNSVVGFKDEGSRIFKVFLVTKMKGAGWKQPVILAKEITTDFNDGPVTFNDNGNMLYYSRNNSINKYLRNISDTTNKLGIYSAELINEKWTNIKAFPFNNPKYSLITPSLTPDGERIYFASDMPGGSGGMDLYYCDRRNNEWDQPINLGPVINTSKNESFPFACKYGKLYFASDGHKGLGGKDLFYTREINGEWIAPVHLDSAINSTADDFGIVTDSTFENGFFSTNRRKTDDIFSFRSAPIEFTNCDSIRENNYCFTFYDEQHQLIDTLSAIYQWDFGDGLKHQGLEVRHCFPGPGSYTVKLSIMDELTGKAIAEQVEYKVDLEKIEQAYINAINMGLVDQPISFDGVKTCLKHFRITDYFWNFGEGFKPGGPFMSMTFRKSGEYTVRLGLLGERDSLGIIPKTCVEKKINVYDRFSELTFGEGKKAESTKRNEDPEEYDKIMQTRIYCMNDLSERQKVKIKDALMVSGGMTVAFNQYGISTSSMPFLDNIAGFLIGNPEIRLEIILHADDDEIQSDTMKISERWAQELGFYLKNKEVGINAYHCKGIEYFQQVLEPVIPHDKWMDGLIEFIFMEH